MPKANNLPEINPRPTASSSPVIIPSRSTRDPVQSQLLESRTDRRQNVRKSSRRAERHTTHSPDAIPPAVAALLAITSIPRLNNSVRRKSGAGNRLTVDSILERTDISEKDLSMSLGRSPLDFLLSSPDEMDEDPVGSENGRESIMSSRTMSSESMPSLDDDSIIEASPSFNSPITPGPRGKRSYPNRRARQISSAGQSVADDPLSLPDIDLDDLDFRVFQRSMTIENVDENPTELQPMRMKSAFKSNLTASLKAFRSAAKSLSSLKPPMITPDDFLTRSIISIDPRVPFTDERMPPLLEDIPTAALRRYLNPTTNAPIEAHVPSSLAQTMSATKCTASIQMQTYKVSRASKSTAPNVISRRTQTTSEDVVNVAAGPVARQRDMRENSDFIRIAVMEMAMRKNGKLDDNRPGRAKWALPPRKPPTKPYEIGENGVPIRWIAVTRF